MSEGNSAEDDDLYVTRAIVQWLHYVPARAKLALGGPVDLDLVVFAHEALFAETTEALEALEDRAQTPPEDPSKPPIRFASNAFLPTGMFAADDAGMGHRAVAVLYGEVQASRRLVNQLTQVPFDHIRVATFPGLIDIVLEKSDAGAPRVGSKARVSGWLVGRHSAGRVSPLVHKGGVSVGLPPSR